MAAVQSSLALAAILLLVVLIGLAGFAAYQLRDRHWPEWIDIGDYQLRSRFLEIGIAAVLASLLVSTVVAYSYGLRQNTLMALGEQANAEQIKRLTAEAKKRPADEAPNRLLKENSDLRQKLSEAENKLADLEKAQSQKRLSPEQRQFLVDALKPYAGQKVAIASIRGDEDSEVVAKDFVSVFEAAGWDHLGEAGVTAQDFPRDPVGVEITLNEQDARKNSISDGVAVLINSVRKLGLVYDGTVYMDNVVPSGQALVKIGKKLRK